MSSPASARYRPAACAHAGSPSPQHARPSSSRPASGRVAFAGPFRGYGQILIIEHDGGWTTLIANLGSLGVTVGDEVRQGDPVGSAPNTPRPQITLELRQGEAPVDIVALLR